jgi:selenide,water dikinase
VELHTNARVVAITETQVQCQDRPPIGCDAAILVTGAAPAAWLADSGLALDARGFVRVDEQLRSVSHPQVFAAGDVASIDGHRLAKSGVFAVRQGPILSDNLQRAVDGRALMRYRPQRRTLSLISTGDHHAVASWGQLSAEGAWAWHLKDWIDRRWMRKYQQLPRMHDADEADEADGGQPMHCAGCGSKVSASVLSRVLAGLDPGSSPELLVGLGDDAAVLRPPPGQVLVQSVDHFRSFVDDPWTFGRITAVHCLSDLHAMGAAPHSAQAMVTLAWTSEDKLEHELRALLAGALSVLRAEGAMLIGGHTAQGAETAFGLAVNGFADADGLLRKDALRAGEVLILSKPIGTGVILAADMRARAAGASLAAALDSMLVSNAAAAACLRAHGARACTDITGFGLLGHLVEMLTASGVDARLDLARVPVLPAALDLLADGIESTLAPSNGAFFARLTGAAPSTAHLALLADPQTAGGLLAGVPAARAAPAVAALRALGYPHACIIGEATAAASAGTPLVTLAGFQDR